MVEPGEPLAEQSQGLARCATLIIRAGGARWLRKAGWWRPLVEEGGLVAPAG